jgi:hypothetical protein
MSVLAFLRGPFRRDDLSTLSLVHVPQGHRVPSPPSNEDRLRAFRAMQQPEIGNSHPWAFSYAAGERPLTAEECRCGFRFKYGG